MGSRVPAPWLLASARREKKLRIRGETVVLGSRGFPDAGPLPLNLERLGPGGGGCPQSGSRRVPRSSNPAECSQAEVTSSEGSPWTLGLLVSL